MLFHAIALPCRFSSIDHCAVVRHKTLMQHFPEQERQQEEEDSREPSSDTAGPGNGARKAEAPAFPGRSFFSFGPGDEGFDRLLSLNELPLLRAFRHGMMLVMPLLVGAAVATLINNFPLPLYQHFMTGLFGPNWKNPGIVLYNGSIEILAIAATITLSDCLVSRHNSKRPGQAILPVMGAVTSLACLFIMIGPRFDGNAMILPWAGIRGLFGALIISCCACTLFVRLCRIRRLRLSSYSEGADPVLPHMFDALLPSLCTMFVFLAARETLASFGVASLQQAFYEAVRDLFADADADAGFGLGALYVFLVDLFWFFGIHGTDILTPVTHDVLVRGMELNSIAINSQNAPTHIFTKYFFEVYIFPGGAGATLGLLAAIFLRSRDFGTRRVAAFSLVPGIFNINELLIFGLPIVLNPAFLPPFILAPILLLGISYPAVVSGLAPLPVYQVDWIMPPLINGYLATGSWKGAALQAVNLAVATLVYIPFVLLTDRIKIINRRKAFHELTRIAESGSRSPSGKRCTDRSGSVGALARSLANDMAANLKAGNDFLYLCYQPKINLAENSVPCVEALLRWQHPFYGHVPPILVLAIAEDADLIRQLDNLVIGMAFEQQAEWRKNGIVTSVSVNLSESQLQDKHFPVLLDLLFSRTGLPAGAILCEVRESLALRPGGRHLTALKAIHATGAHLVIDDFGKGCQALAQLDLLPLHELQIDRALISDVADNPLHQSILCDIQEMSLKKGIKTSAEYIESRDQLEMLLELNFSTFQGYHFSEPVRADKCAEFIRAFASGANSAPSVP